jgi:hypothetical protein
MHYDDHDTGSGPQEMGTSAGVPKVSLNFDHRKFATERNPTHRPRKCRQSHHLRAGAQASTKKSREAL